MLRAALLTASCLLFATPALAAPPDDATKKLWSKKCASCHGDDGKAETKLGKKYDADSFVDAGWQQRHSDEKIRKVIENGVPKTKMKAYKGKLTPEEITALVGMVRSFNPGK